MAPPSIDHISLEETAAVLKAVVSARGTSQMIGSNRVASSADGDGMAQLAGEHPLVAVKESSDEV